MRNSINCILGGFLCYVVFSCDRNYIKWVHFKTVQMIKKGFFSTGKHRCNYSFTIIFSVLLFVGKKNLHLGSFKFLQMFARFCWKIIFENNSIIVSSDVVFRQMWDDWKKIVWNLILTKKSGPSDPKMHQFILGFSHLTFSSNYIQICIFETFCSQHRCLKKYFERWISKFSSNHHQIILLGPKKLSFINIARR